MRQLDMEQRLLRLEEGIAAIRAMLDTLLKLQQAEVKSGLDADIMTVKQLSDFLGLDANAIYAKCAKGDIPYFKIGKHYRFEKADVLKWIQGQKEHAEFSIDDYVDKYMQKHVLKG